MKDFKKLQDIWMTEKNFNPNEEKEVINLILQYQKSKKRNIRWLIFATILLFPVFIAVTCYGSNLHWSRIAGEVLIFIGLFLTLILKIKSLKKTNDNELLPNDEFINSLKKSLSKSNQINMLQISALVVIGLGYGFFIYQDIAHNQTIMILSCLAILLFMNTMYFKFRPFAEAVSQKKSAKLLEKIKEIERNFK